MAAFLSVVRDVALLLVRIGLGGLMLVHGWIRWTDPAQGVDKQVAYFSQFGTPYPEVVVWSLIVIELLGGVFLIAGFLTPLVGALVVAEQAFLIAYTTWYRDLLLVNPDGSYRGGYEYNVVVGLLGLVLLAFGGGRAAVDRIFRRPPESEVEESPTATTQPLQRVGA